MSRTYEIDQRDRPFSSLSIGDWLAFNTEGDICQKISDNQIGFTVGKRFEAQTISRVNDGVYPVYFYESIALGEKMISDVLSDAAQEIKDYLREYDRTFYEHPDLHNQVLRLLKEMEALRQRLDDLT